MEEEAGALVGDVVLQDFANFDEGVLVEEEVGDVGVKVKSGFLRVDNSPVDLSLLMHLKTIFKFLFFGHKGETKRNESGEQMHARNRVRYKKCETKFNFQLMPPGRLRDSLIYGPTYSKSTHMVRGTEGLWSGVHARHGGREGYGAEHEGFQSGLNQKFF